MPLIDTLPFVLIDAFPPHADVLRAKSAELVTDDMLAEISRADYGWEADEHLAALLPVRDSMRVPAATDWHPNEVLALTRWSQPDDPGCPPGHIGERGHIMRAFCCAALLRAAAEPANAEYVVSENETLIQLIESALLLDRGLPKAAGRFLSWRIPLLDPYDEERPFFVFGAVALALLILRETLSEAEVGILVSFVEREEAASRDALNVRRREPCHGSFLTQTYHNQRHDAWRRLAAQLRSAFPDSDRVIALVRRIETT